MQPLNLQKWIDANRARLRPPVGNVQIWEDREFMVTVVGGPNARRDFHINEGEEFFYQLEGDIYLRLYRNGKVEELPIRQGEIYLLPGNVPHSPQRPPGTVGLVIERKRLSHEIDSFLWLCEGCGTEVHKASFHLNDIVKQLPPAFAAFYEDPVASTCKSCGLRATRAAAHK